jgi:hypothetical protein
MAEKPKNPGTRGTDFDPSHRGGSVSDPPQTPPKHVWPKQEPLPAPVEKTPTLKELGITDKHLADTARKLAAIPDGARNDLHPTGKSI